MFCCFFVEKKMIVGDWLFWDFEFLGFILIIFNVIYQDNKRDYF